MVTVLLDVQVACATRQPMNATVDRQHSEDDKYSHDDQDDLENAAAARGRGAGAWAGARRPTPAPGAESA